MDELATIPYDDFIRDSGKAILVEIDGRTQWFPKSVVDDHDESKQELDVQRWFIDKDENEWLGEYEL